MQTSCAPSPSTRKHAAEGQLDLCLPQRVACEVWYHRNARSNQKKSTLRWPMHARGPAGECRCDGRHGRAGECRGVWEISRTVHAQRPAWTCGPRAGARTGACAAVGRSGRVRTNEQSRALEPMRAFKPVRHAGGGCQTATVAHQRPRFKTAPTTSRAAPNRTSTASTSNVNERPARKSSGRPST